MSHQVVYRCDESNATGSGVVEANVSKIRCQGCNAFLKINVTDLTLDGPKGHKLLRIAEIGKAE